MLPTDKVIWLAIIASVKTLLEVKYNHEFYAEREAYL
jgi:hypothetical protein